MKDGFVIMKDGQPLPESDVLVQLLKYWTSGDKTVLDDVNIDEADDFFMKLVEVAENYKVKKKTEVPKVTNGIITV
jgi:hypothetical protein